MYFIAYTACFAWYTILTAYEKKNSFIFLDWKGREQTKQKQLLKYWSWNFLCEWTWILNVRPRLKVYTSIFHLIYPCKHQIWNWKNKRWQKEMKISAKRQEKRTMIAVWLKEEPNETKRFPKGGGQKIKQLWNFLIIQLIHSNLLYQY